MKLSALSCLALFTLLSFSTLFGQQYAIDGYVFESGNRGYLNQVKVTVSNNKIGFSEKVDTDKDGHFKASVPSAGTYILTVFKDYFYEKTETVEVSASKEFVKIELLREPGYVFEVTLAEQRDDENIVVDQIQGALIEVYNNTTRESVMVLDNYNPHEFKLNMQKGNHYTILIRKEGYLAKRMEVYVNVKGCILCFEGVGSVTPGVTDNLTENNNNGVLLANVELEQIFKGKKIPINNLYYDLGKWDLLPQGEEELDNVIKMMKDNPRLKIELGSHTDSRGSSQANQVLSEKRARSAVNYLRTRGPIPSSHISYKGFGETELVNGCKDGVTCAEEEHAINRRTELKILGIDEDGAIKQTLVQMKQEEFMDIILAEMESEGQIKVVGNDTLAVTNPVRDTKPATIKEEIIDDSGLVNKHPDPVMHMDDIKEETQLQKQAVEEVIENTVEVVEEGSTTLDKRYKLVIHESDTALEPENALWKKHPKLNVYFTGSKFLYTIGNYKTKEACADFKQSAAKFNYPDSYIVAFANGVLVEE
jgi:outer membrane protein OmpA-like peptidoglycan-associated protein